MGELRTGNYDRDGNAISIEQWSELHMDGDYIRVAWDTVDDASVSTVWIGIDYSWGQGTPLIFETMVFGGPLDDWAWRWATEAEALVGHKQALEQVVEAAVKG